VVKGVFERTLYGIADVGRGCPFFRKAAGWCNEVKNIKNAHRLGDGVRTGSTELVALLRATR